MAIAPHTHNPAPIDTFIARDNALARPINLDTVNTACPDCGDLSAQMCVDTGIITCIECLYFN